jgi:phosphate transport system permease protein
MGTNSQSHDLHTSVAARARTKKRYRKQTTLKFAGIAAIAFAALALVSLVYSIVSRAVLARTETFITLDVKLDEQTIDPTGKRDPDTLYGASYMGLVKTRLREKFPGLGRSEKRKLYSLVSSSAPYELRDHLIDNPDLIGKTISFDYLADDDVDLYIKGKLGNVRQLDADGLAHLMGGQNFGEEITVYIQSNSLDAGLNLIKQALGERADIVERQALDQKRAALTMAARFKKASSEEDRKKLLAQQQRYETQHKFLMDQVNDLRKRASSSGGNEKLNPSLPSLFLKLNGGMIKVSEIETDHVKGKIVRPLKSNADVKGGEWSFMVVAIPEENRKISDNQIIWLEQLQSEGRIISTFNWHLFTSADASEPEEAGILGGLLGTFWTMLVTFLLSFPIGVGAALYLEEFAPQNAVTHFVEVNINNLAAVPSIVFGLLGLAVFVNFFGMPYSSSLVGGIVLSLMTLPTVIIASRAAIKAVPPSIKEAALGIGASKMQTVFQHVLPLAMPGIMTGSIIGMAQALGETAPLLMIGMVAFIVDPPTAVTDAASSLPVLIYLWADRAEMAFDMRTAAAILVLLSVLVLMNAVAILLRKRFERRW